MNNMPYALLRDSTPSITPLSLCYGAERTRLITYAHLSVATGQPGMQQTYHPLWTKKMVATYVFDIY